MNAPLPTRQTAMPTPHLPISSRRSLTRRRRAGSGTRRVLFAVAAVCLLSAAAIAHDAWLEMDGPVIRAGDVAQVRVLLGNHGNKHRDFKLAGKLDLSKGTLSVVSPDGQESDLKASAIDLGLGPRDGYWMARVPASSAGVYVVAHSSNSKHGSTRSLKFAKAVFTAARSLDQPGEGKGFDRVLGQTLEIIPLTDPTQVQTGEAVRVRVLLQGKPLAGARVSFIPRGTVLAVGMDDEYERIADDAGEVSWTPEQVNDVLIAVHHLAADESGEGYEATQYAATLVIRVTNRRG